MNRSINSEAKEHQHQHQIEKEEEVEKDGLEEQTPSKEAFLQKQEQFDGWKSSKEHLEALQQDKNADADADEDEDADAELAGQKEHPTWP